MLSTLINKIHLQPQRRDFQFKGLAIQHHRKFTRQSLTWDPIFAQKHLELVRPNDPTRPDDSSGIAGSN